MKLSLFIRLSLVLLCACGYASHAAELQGEIDRILCEAAADVHVGVEVVSMTTGKRVYERNAHHLFVPASCLKMMTGAAALHILGPDHRFETKILTDGRVASKSIKGNLYLQGGADPELAVCDLEELISYLRARNIEKIEGNLYVDHTFFDEVSQGPGWMWDEGDERWNAPMSGLMLNHSCIDVWVKPSEQQGQAPCVSLCPATSYVTLQNRAVTDAQADNLCVQRRWMRRENVIEVTGQISSAEEPLHFTLSVEDPHLYAGYVFRDMLLKAGIVVRGKIGVKVVPPGAAAVVLGAHASRPLSLLVEEMMKSSDNLYADCLFKAMGARQFGVPGTWQKGAQAVREFLRTVVDVDKMVVLDGSGLSRYNLISAHQCATFLSWVHTHFGCKGEFLSALPIAGRDGTLIHRMEQVEGKVRAKTGTMTGISSLAGYITTDGGEVLAFCILQSGFTEKASVYKAAVEDAICTLLVRGAFSGI